MIDIILRVILALTGAAIIWLGLNVALGGIVTLGWQGPIDFLEVTDRAAFAAQDSHVRFLGGVWLGAGLFMLAGSIFLKQLRGVLMAIIAMIVVGGLARIAANDPGLLLGPQIAPSLLAELILFLALGLWIHRIAGKSDNA